MSLQQAAKYLEMHGRDNDTELVHMSKNEVNSLRQLAHMHGVDLTKNPNTGLTEASVLGNILPMVIGGATAVFAPELLPYVAGAGGLYNYSKTGSLAKGAMTGLGVYGGGMIGAGIAGLGSATAASTLSSEAADIGYGTNSAVNAQDVLLNRAGQTAAGTSLGASQLASPFATGASAAVSDPSALAAQMGGWGNVAKYAAMAAAPAILSSITPQNTEPTGKTATITPYSYQRNPVDPSTLKLTGANYVPGQNPDTSERLFFNPTYTALPTYQYTVNSAEGGEIKADTVTMAEGGMAPSEMTLPSSFNNPNAPMSHNKNTSYANYSQMPMPQGVFNPNATLMADGGVADMGGATGQMQQSPNTVETVPSGGFLGKILDDFGGGVNSVYNSINNGVKSIKFADGGAIGYADRGMVDMKSNDMPDMSEFGNLQNARSQMVPVPLGNGLSVMPNIPQTADFKQALSQFKQSPSGMIGYDTALSPTMSAGISAAGNLTEGAHGVENVAARLSKQLSPDSGISAYISKAPGSFQPSAAGLQYHQRFDSGGVANSGFNREGPVEPYTGMPYSVKTPDPLGALFSMGPNGQEFTTPLADGGQADGHLGDYSDGGRLLKGPGDGVSDSIPATIAGKQPARLADGEFVVPARIVSELGNGSTDAGAKKLYAMLDRIQHARRESIGKGKVAKNSNADRYLPA